MSGVVEGGKQVQDSLSHLPAAIQERARVHIDTARRAMEAQARLNAPMAEEDGGQLKASIYSQVTHGGLNAQVGSRGVEYARHVEFGTNDTPAQPYLFPAFLANVRTLRKNLRGMLKDSGFKLRSRVRRADVTRRLAA